MRGEGVGSHDLLGTMAMGGSALGDAFDQRACLASEPAQIFPMSENRGRGEAFSKIYLDTSNREKLHATH